MRRKKISYFMAGAGLTVLIALSLNFTTPNERYFEITKNLDIFATLFKEVNAYYVDEVNPNQLIKTGIDAMLASLDPYTNYIPEDDIEDYRTMTTGQYGGIGALIGRMNGKNMILMPYEGFPANESGLKIGDEILEVDGVDVTDKNTSDISQLLKGQAKTDLTITVKRFGVIEPIEITLKREKITIDNVPYYGFVDDEVGYIKLSDFTTGAGKEVSNALNELKNEGAKKIILDLRDNPGGLLMEAVNVSNVFIPKGKEVVSTKGKVTDWNKTYNTLNSSTDEEIPVAVLTSSRSASAAEIVSGVIQDYDRGVLVGEKTFGKGLVQATRPLTYNSQLKVTTAKYYIPSGRCIQAINYSDRNEDGSIGKVADSLKSEFETTNGRLVYDGGGIDPDLEVKPQNLAPITASLIARGLIFDYATMYYYEHENIGDAADFTITAEEYNEFVDWLSDKEYDYTTRVEKTIESLTEYAKKEKYYSDIQDEIEILKTQVFHNKEQDLKQFKAEIKEILESEIASRYYLRDGMVEASFDNDPQLQAAIEVLRNNGGYKEILAKATE
ncbi:MAG TPA: peptidase S41 [Cytophagales bacterium]|jgi:carboxyl-terminal processing protease|nr:peptidase S41 [Cytophagales bacterium]